MKKILAALLAVATLLSLAACSRKQAEEALEAAEALKAIGDTLKQAGKTDEDPDESRYYGTWTVAALEGDGSRFTVDELEAMGETEFSAQLRALYFVVKEGGKVYFHATSANKELFDWSCTPDGLCINNTETLTWSDGLLCLEFNGAIILFEKTSDSQIIPAETAEDAASSADPAAGDAAAEEAPAAETPPAETEPAESAGPADDEIRPAFQEAMDSYEAFFDEYAAFMQSYAEASDPMGMLLDYATWMAQYAETMEKLNAVDESELTTAEALYYTEVMARISQKLILAVQ